MSATGRHTVTIPVTEQAPTTAVMGAVIIVGTGRCGTEWCARTLRSAGIRASHQAVVRHEHVLGRTPIDWHDYAVEVSYEATPIAAQVAHRVILVTRHPFPVARSWVALGAFDDDTGFDDLHASIRVHAPEVLGHPDPMVRALRFWCAWNMLGSAQDAEHVRIEDLTADALVGLVGLPARYPPVRLPRHVNTRAWQKRPITGEPTWDTVDQLSEIAAMFGYHEDR